jgi:selenocysteine lyase/cysteine desulfurase
VLWGRRPLLDALDVPKLDPAPNEAPERLETGTQNHEGIVGAAAAVDYLASLAPDAGSRRSALIATFAELHSRGDALLRQLHAGLSDVPGVRIHGPPPGHPRTPTLSFTMAGRSTDTLADALAQRGLFCSHGDFYATTIIERLGVGDAGVLRVGCSVYTTADEIARVIDAVSRIAP